MKIHREGFKTIFLTFLFVTILILAIALPFQIPVWFEFALYLSGSVLLLCTFLFFRVPVRKALYADGKIFSGADGKVVAIEEIHESEYFNDKRKQVSVFMSVANVHVNYMPLTGVVNYFKYHPGKHLFAWMPKSSTENERTTLVVDNEVHGEVMIKQIAGAFARRIVCYPREGNKVEQGSEMGIIKFGSRVDILLPLHAGIQVSLNQHVKGGETLIAVIGKRY